MIEMERVEKKYLSTKRSRKVGSRVSVLRAGIIDKRKVR